MNEIKEGMFIRTDDGKINKFKRYITDKKRVCETDMYARLAVDNIVKASFDIIDLIEVGDYVNGKKIVNVGCLTNGPRENTKVIDYYITPSAVSYLENEYIKSIVTKEQFESMSYRIGE